MFLDEDEVLVLVWAKDPRFLRVTDNMQVSDVSLAWY
jgi:hypothetical protein